MQPVSPQARSVNLKYPRRYAYIGFVLFLFIDGLVHIEGNISLQHYLHRTYRLWELCVLEYSVPLAILAAAPLVVAFDRRLPIAWSTWRINIVRHALATVVFSAWLTVGSIALRKLLYAAFGSHYDVDMVPIGFGYDYVTHAEAYVELLGASYAYRYIVLQILGEAKEFTKPEAGAPVESLERPQRFLVRKLGKEFLVAVDDIERLEAQGNYVNLHVRGHAYPLRSTMSVIESKLDPAKFIRIHRSHIVNLDFLVEIQPLDTGDASLKLRDGTMVPCSRNYRGSLRDKAAKGTMRAAMS
jgi:hypothetical protein